MPPTWRQRIVILYRISTACGRGYRAGMSGLGTWARKRGGLIAVWLMATLILGPTLDTFVCKNEGEPAAASSMLSAGDVMVSADHDKADPSHSSPTACAHGHCHHSLNLGLIIATATIAPTPVAEPHDLADSSVHPSRFPSGLERPPRA